MATGVASWSKTASANASADQNVNMAEGMAPSQVNDGCRAMMASTAMWRDDLAGITTGGTSTAYTVATNQGFASLAALDGRLITIVMHTSSGAAATLSVDGLAAQKVRLQTGVDAPAAALVQGSPYTVRFSNANSEFLVTQQTTGIPSGVVVPFAGSVAPGGWYLCTGQAVSRTLNATLFATIGTTYGAGDGSTTFNVPDLRGRVVAGVDGTGRISIAGGNFDASVLGSSGGLQNHTLTTTECPSGLVTLNVTDHSHNYDQAQSYGCMSNSPCGSSAPTTHAAATTTGVNGGTGYISLSDHGGNGAHTVLQPTLVLNYIIKA